MPLRLAIVGFGKIARDEHVLAIESNPDMSLVATAGGRNEPPASARRFKTHGELLTACAGEVDAVVICTPPGPRYAIARDCLEAGLDVMLEKPPCATLAAVESLIRLAENRGRVLFAAWHSQFAPAVAPVQARVAGRAITDLEIVWREDVRRWHPGQDWVFGPGGFGVFDPGINALSIVSSIAPEALRVEAADLVVPRGRVGPIAANVRFAAGEARLDWRETANQQWTIRFRAAGGEAFEITGGGTALAIDGVDRPLEQCGEYPSLYRRFVELVLSRRSDVDIAPLRAVADAFLICDRRDTDPFSWDG